MSPSTKTGNKTLSESELEHELVVSEARVEAFHMARKQTGSTEPIPARIEVLQRYIKQLKAHLKVA